MKIKYLLTGILFFGISLISASQPNMGSKTNDTTSTADSLGCGHVEYGGMIYHTIVIGKQCWMRENLNIGKWTDQAILQRQGNNGIVEKYCFGNDFVQCDLWGGLYQWDEMMQYVETSGTQGICPPGWHIPTAMDLKSLIGFLGGESMAGGKLKTTGSRDWQIPNVGATNSSGFSAYPGGYLDYMAQKWYDQHRAGYYWTSERMSDGTAEAMTLSFRNTTVSRYEEYKPSALSVRCIRND